MEDHRIAYPYRGISEARLPATPYLDENVYNDQIWIWDSAFMVLYSRYAPSAFPGLQTLDNIYYPIHKQVETGLKIHLRDNPPFWHGRSTITT